MLAFNLILDAFEFDSIYKSNTEIINIVGLKNAMYFNKSELFATWMIIFYV